MPEFDASRHVIKLKGKDYLPVAARLLWFRHDNPDWGIVTTPVEINMDKQYAIFSASIFDGAGKLMATATKMENIGGFGDFIEKAETGSVGRALAYCGYGTQFAPEIDETERRTGGGQSAPQNNNQNGPYTNNTPAPVNRPINASQTAPQGGMRPASRPGGQNARPAVSAPPTPPPPKPQNPPSAGAANNMDNPPAPAGMAGINDTRNMLNAAQANARFDAATAFAHQAEKFGTVRELKFPNGNFDMVAVGILLRDVLGVSIPPAANHGNLWLPPASVWGQADAGLEAFIKTDNDQDYARVEQAYDEGETDDENDEPDDEGDPENDGGQDEG